MEALPMTLRRIIRRWEVSEERASRRQFYGKTFSDRFDGWRRSRRNEAKVLLLAMAPMAAIGPFIGQWSDASLFGKALLALLSLWFLAVAIGGGFIFFRANVRASRDHSKEK
ncbi:hypothetical protein E4M02_12910 [Brevundimonas sp. S30B]|uniref:hypothetical protein n=1 Tax=unclassified Brevundimonas TaxID=2622653 RepID=UPI001071B487|nr:MULTISPECIES: hypothetical protein [unclassified Brevundimonas]QBX36549.1 hypothetical protein E4M01_01560 [Brevundimonas sp. MF30-B]TFW00849.1 hypothetical protein E4M02_12910 [Brevundimonas sp. S30B]